MLLIPTAGSHHSGLLPTHHNKKEHRDTAGGRTDKKDMKNVGLNFGQVSQCTKKDISLINGTCPVHLFVSQLEINVGMPSLLLRLPLHPTFKHLT